MRTKKTLGAVGMTAIIAAGLAVVGWLALTVYNNLDTRVTVAQDTATTAQTTNIHMTALLEVMALKEGIPQPEINQLLGN